MSNEEMTESLLDTICYVIDILPTRVQEFGKFSKIEEYYLQERELEIFAEKMVNIILKIQCYHEFEIYHGKWYRISMFVENFGSMEAFREALAKELKDPETETHLIKLYGGKDKAVAASLSATGDKEDMARFAKETDDIYRQFAEAMQTGNANLKEEALRRLAESNKAVWHFENVRYYLLQLADTFERIPELIEATDKEYGVGVIGYMAKAIIEHYGVS